MSKYKIGDKLTIHCYKHDKTLYQTSSEAVVLEENDDFMVCANFNTKITEEDGRSYQTKEPAILFFYKHDWFNIIGQLKSYGLFYYCNIATPYIIDNNIIKYIDYDLDLRVFPDGGFRILDRNEYNYHKRKMKYPQEIDLIIKRELSHLIEMKRAEQGPFAKGCVEKYFQQYQNLIKN